MDPGQGGQIITDTDPTDTFVTTEENMLSNTLLEVRLLRYGTYII
jgi:hypothetical protein